jgi:hypothetical protein
VKPRVTNDLGYSFGLNGFQREVARPARLELATPCLEAVRTTLPNLARGVANRTESASWSNSGKQLSLSFVAFYRRIAVVFHDLRDIFVTASRL